MFKLYKKFKPIDWVFTVIIIGFSVLQVYTMMVMVDYVSGIVQAIMNLNFHNHPADMLSMFNNASGDQLAMITKLFDMNFANSPNYVGTTEGWNNIYNLLANVNNPDIQNSLNSIANIRDASTAQIWFNGGMMLLLAFSSMAIQIIIAILAAAISSGFATELRKELNEKVSSFSLAEINKFSTASLITRTTNDIENVMMANLLMMRMVFAAPITAIWAICKVQASSSELTIATIVAIIFLVIGLLIIMLLVLPKFKAIQKLIDKINGITQESLTGIRVVRAYNAEEYQENKFDKANNNLTKAQVFTGRIMGLMSPLMTIVMNGLTLAIYWIGAYLINKNTPNFNYATITSFTMLSSQIIMAFMMLLMMFVLWPRASISADRINEVLNTECSIKDPISPKTISDDIKGEIEFKDVSFRYPDAKNNVLEHISFKVNKGETIAFIGPTGSGKSSLINLVTRLYDATSGKVLIDGVDVKDLKQTDLRSRIGYVPQKGILLSGTINSNVAFGKPTLNQEEIVDACKVACADEFINNLDKKYDFEIAQGGTNVSGGQRQRLCIARAIAIKPEIFVFDDSFSALDFKTDLQVRENIKNSQKDATKMIVAQRIGTIMDADKIVVLKDGKVVGIGTHQELLKTCPTYLDIALSQLSKEELGL